MRVLYLSTWDFANEESDGVCKKIKAQIEVFENNGFHVDFIFIRGNAVIYRENGREHIIAHVGTIKKTSAYLKMYKAIKYKKYDYIYNRYGMMDTFYYRVLNRLKRNGAAILVEIPTYPYDGEQKSGVLYSIMFGWDKWYRKRLNKVVKSIITYSKDETIWNISAIHIMNGIDINRIRTIEKIEQENKIINLFIVAYMQPYHGYERLLLGLKNYYMNGGKREILCHFAGEGPEKEFYEKTVNDNQLNSNVIFYGGMANNELDDLYRIADIGICTLGGYKKNLFWSSELKAREYLAHGLPIVIGMDSDLEEIVNPKYILQVENNAQNIEIDSVIEFYDRIYNGKVKAEEIRNSIRTSVEKTIGMDAVMEPIIKMMRQKR